MAKKKIIPKNPFDRIKDCFIKYSLWQGRANRAEYWWFVLLNLVLSFVPFISNVAAIVLFLPLIAVQVRRLHDTGRSAWWLLLELFAAIVLIAGGALLYVSPDSIVLASLFFILFLVLQIILLVFMLLPGDTVKNKYGKVPA